MPPTWYPINDFVDPVGAYLWNLSDRIQYPFQVPDFHVVKGWARYNDLDGNGWFSQFTLNPDVEVIVPGATVSYAGIIWRADHMIGLIDYPSDELPPAYALTHDRFEVWTGPGRTGEKLVEIDSDATFIDDNEYMVDYTSGMVRFSEAAEGLTLYLTYFGLQGANRAAYHHYLASNVSSICSALLVGLTHNLKFIGSLQPGSDKYLDFSGVTGTPQPGDWVMYIGDGGVLPREAGLTADTLTWYCLNVLPVADGLGSIGTYDGPVSSIWSQGGFDILSAATRIKTPEILSGADLLIDATGLVTVDGPTLIDLGATEDMIIGSDSPTPPEGKVTVSGKGVVTIEANDEGGFPGGDALVITDSFNTTKLTNKGRLVTDQPITLDMPLIEGGQFDQLQAFNQSNAINATGWTVAPLTGLIVGGKLKPQRVWLELESTASEGITNLKVWQRNSGDLSITTFWDSGVIDLSGSYATYFFDVAPLLNDVGRTWGISFTCANSVAGAVKISGVWVECHLGTDVW